MDGTMPARRGPWCAGILLLALQLVACDGPVPGRAPDLELDDGTIRLSPGARVHDVEVRLVEQGEFGPEEVRARPRDAVRFIAADARTHAIVFDAAVLDAAAREFLSATDQLRGPPLISPGATWIILLEGAPAGEYPFVCLTHGGEGRLVVAEES
jgi:plastocyanin